MEERDQKVPYWDQDPHDLAGLLGTELSGLSSESSTERLARFGPNSVEETSALSAAYLLLRQFQSPLVLILVGAALISLGLGQWVDATLILAIIAGSVLLGFFQEYRASAALEALKKRLALTCRTLRDGKEQLIPVASLVPGDVILLSAGKLVPADGLLLEATDFLVSEAALTGESFPVEKRPGRVAADAPLPERSNSVFLGTSVQSGTAKFLAVRTGRLTEFGTLAARLRVPFSETDFTRGVRAFGLLLVRMMILIVFFVLIINLLRERPLIDSLLFAVALAVGLSPELLPAIISVTLSIGARNMQRHGVIVRHLESIENLGSMDVFCTDKTGTLTEGTIVLSAALDACGQCSDKVQRLAFLNAAFETGIENPLDAALVSAGEKAGMTPQGFTKIDEIPYDFVRRRLTIVLAEDAAPTRHLLITKGAFETVLDICTQLELDGTLVPLDAAWRTKLKAIFTHKGKKGLRVLAVATRECAVRRDYSRADEQEMTFQGFLTFHDPPKPEMRQTIQDLARRGVAVKVISGDNRHVTIHVAKSVGLETASIRTGREIAMMSNEALWRLAPQIDLFVEMTPQQKERIVRALQQAGHVVGYLGDGINDAPALRAADVGISVEQAVDVARATADIVLLERDLEGLRLGIEEGRRSFANTLKYISITLSANFGNMISMALATPFLPFLPLAAKQILLNNFLSDLPAVALSSDAVDPEQLLYPQRWNIKEIQRFMIVFGLLSSIFDLLSFGILLFIFHAEEVKFQTAWFMLSLLTELAVLLVLRTRKPVFQSHPSRLLLWLILIVSAMTLASPFLGHASALFGFAPLSVVYLSTIGGIALLYILATEFIKLQFFGKRRIP